MQKKLSAREVAPRRDIPKPKDGGKPSFSNDLKCFACQGYGHKAADCRRCPPRIILYQEVIVLQEETEPQLTVLVAQFPFEPNGKKQMVRH